MSLREEDKQNKNCPSRGLGLGLAAAAIGVGVGAALYYFISKRPENPNSTGSTQAWACDPDNTLHLEDSWQDDSFVTISEHSTTDTSMNNTSHNTSNDFESESMSENSSDSVSESESDSDDSQMDMDSDFSLSYSDVNEWDVTSGDVTYSTDGTVSDSDVTDWDITSSVDLPFIPSSLPWIIGYSTNRNASNLVGRVENGRTEIATTTKGQVFRQRTWSLEECSICFDVILRDQEVMSLPCTHHFHTKCILPWLKEQQTCPNCRKSID